MVHVAIGWGNLSCFLDLVRLIGTVGEDKCGCCYGLADPICLFSQKDFRKRETFICFGYSVRPNIFVGRVEGSAVYRKWYFEVTMDHIEKTTHMMPHLRIGWANTSGYVVFESYGL